MIKLYTYNELKEKIDKLKMSENDILKTKENLQDTLNLVNNSSFAIETHLDLFQIKEINGEVVFLFYMYGLSEKIRLMDKLDNINKNDVNTLKFILRK